MKTLLNKPGVSLLLVGAVLMFLIRPIIGGVWVVGSVLAPITFVVGILGIVGGLYLIGRSTLGPSA